MQLVIGAVFWLAVAGVVGWGWARFRANARAYDAWLDEVTRSDSGMQ